MSAYLESLDKQHRQGDGAVKCHGNKPWQLWKGLAPPRPCRFTPQMNDRHWGQDRTHAAWNFFIYLMLHWRSCLCGEKHPQSLRSLSWNAASHVIWSKWAINEVRRRLIGNENKFVPYIDLKAFKYSHRLRSLFGFYWVWTENELQRNRQRGVLFLQDWLIDHVAVISLWAVWVHYQGAYQPNSLSISI